MDLLIGKKMIAKTYFFGNGKTCLGLKRQVLWW